MCAFRYEIIIQLTEVDPRVEGWNITTPGTELRFFHAHPEQTDRQKDKPCHLFSRVVLKDRKYKPFFLKTDTNIKANTQIPVGHQSAIKYFL
jgi:hypothetical protein